MKYASQSPPLPDQAKRHFMGLAACAAGRIAALGVLASMAASTSARADNGKHLGWSNPNNPHDGGNCFLRGTGIQKPSGETLIEDLRIGDLVVTASGGTRPIKWIGRRVFRKTGFSWAANAIPIRISRGALAENTPHRDLYVSPGHGVLLDGVLIAAKELVNGVSVTPIVPSDADTIEYLHLLLDVHDVILAEGAAAETYLPSRGDYEKFSNFVEYERLYNEPWPALTPCAPATARCGREHLKALLRLGLPRFARMRDPVEDAYVSAYSRLATRAAAASS